MSKNYDSSGQVNSPGIHGENPVRTDEGIVVTELFALESSVTENTPEPLVLELEETPEAEAPLSMADLASAEASDGDDPRVIDTLVSESEVEPVAEATADPDLAATKAFLAGSEQAFIQLYAKYESPLLLYCKRMLANERVAEDAFQEIWIKVFELRNRKQIEIVFFRGLLFRSARNLCLNMLRVERMRAGSSDQLVNMVSSDVSSQHIEQREIKALIRQALKKLPFDQREAFVLHEYSGYSFKEIAEIMGTTEVNVKVRAYRARTRLRKLIQGWLGLRETDDPSNFI
jgi:RNA polymerase sigma-70 factor (ECF subfamily)